MAISKFGAFTPAKNFFATIFDRRNGVAAPATLYQLNQLVDIINVISANTSLDFVYRISETLGVPVLPLTLMKNSTGGTGITCASGKCAACTGAENPACTGCAGINTSSFYKCALSNASLARTAPGVYELTLAPDFNYTEVIVTFGNIGYTGGIINVVRNSNVSYTIRTIDTATGIAIDGELTNTPIQISFWQ